MTNLFYTLVNGICAMSFWNQILIALPCVFITAGIIYLVLRSVKIFLYKVATSIGITFADDYEPYNAEWMDYNAWRRN